MTAPPIADAIEEFIRTRFRVAAGDTRFSRSQHLFEKGYVDSIGVVELLAFVQETFEVCVPDEQLMSDEFSTIDGIARIVARLADSETDGAGARTG